MPPGMAQIVTLCGSNYRCLEQIFMVPKGFEPSKFDCNSKYIYKIAVIAGILDFRSERFQLFLSMSRPDSSLQIIVNYPFGSGQEFQNRFSRSCSWRPSWIIDLNCIAIFILQVTSIFPNKFRVTWHYRSGEEIKNRFLKWQPLRPSWIFDRNYFSQFWSTRYPDTY